MNSDAAMQLAGTLGAGLSAGIYFTFSVFVMRALARLKPVEGIRAMQAINETVITPLFVLVFFGTAVVSGMEIFRFILRTPSSFFPGGMSLIAALLYLTGTLGTTMAYNVPLNHRLAALDLENPDHPAIWQSYLRHWTRWNHVRTLSSTLALYFWLQAGGG